MKLRYLGLFALAPVLSQCQPACAPVPTPAPAVTTTTAPSAVTTTTAPPIATTTTTTTTAAPTTTQPGPPDTSDWITVTAVCVNGTDILRITTKTDTPLTMYVNESVSVNDHGQGDYDFTFLVRNMSLPNSPFYNPVVWEVTWDNPNDDPNIIDDNDVGYGEIPLSAAPCGPRSN